MDKSISETDRLLIEGDRNLHQGKFTAAIDIFERLLKSIEPSDPRYFNIQRHLVKAYQQNGQNEQAIALCQLMIESDFNLTSMWGNKFIHQLVPPSELQSEEPPAENLVSPRQGECKIQAKSLSQFKQYCQDNLLEKLQTIEAKRIGTWYSIAGSGIVCLVATWALCQLIFSLLRINASILIFYLASLIFVIPVWIIFCQGCIEIYRLNFKNDIIKKIISFIDESGSLKYSNQLLLEDKRQTILAFTQSQIFQDELEEPDRLEQEDCVYGAIGSTDIFFAEILVENVKAGYLNEYEQAEYKGRSVIFRGLFFEAKFPKKFTSRTFIIPNTLQSKIASFNSWRGESVTLEDPEFDKIFQVYGDNQVEARYILSTNLIDRLVKFNHKARRKVYLSFVSGFVYIAIPYSHNLFEAKLFTSMKSFAPLREYFWDLQLMIGIVNDLNLNRKIWGK
ncbi:MAG: DUF3137 domain-containing protein [Cyanobacteria bacterium P01_G01_bin.19]